MYNITVDQAHTYFVGDEQWLVHNVCSIQKLGGLSDALSKGFHLNAAKKGEILLKPEMVDGILYINVKSFGGAKIPKFTDLYEILTGSQKKKALAFANGIISTFGNNPDYAERVAEARLMIEAITTGAFILQ